MTSMPSLPISPALTQGNRIAIFASREDYTTLLRTIDSVCTAAMPNDIIDVLVNGNPHLTDVMCRTARLTKFKRGQVRIWSIALGDKAHAWNQYVHEIWSDADSTFFIDGYVTASFDALDLLASAAKANPTALAATGTPSSGRTAARLKQSMMRDGGIHGNLFMLVRSSMEWIRESNFRLPLGLYRTDATLGAALAFGLNPASYEWDPKRYIVVEPRATWTTEPKHWWSYSVCISQLKRIRRQAQGALENAAVRQLFAREKRPAYALPTSTEELVQHWALKCPAEASRMTRYSPLKRRALMALHNSQERPLATKAPSLVFDSANTP